MVPFKLTVLLLSKNPSIVFDQGASAVCKEDRLAAENQLFQGDCLLLDYFADKPFEELESYNNDQSSHLPTSHDPFIFDGKSIADIDSSLEMFSPLRPRKCSISDILDVLNEDKVISKSRDDGYDSGHADSIQSSIISSDESFLEDSSCVKDSNSESLLKIQTTEVCNEIFNTPVINSPNDMLEAEQSYDPASIILSSNKDAVIVMLDNENQVKYMSTSREKLVNFLSQENSTFTEVQLGRDYIQNSKYTHKDVKETSILPCLRRRGRKRIYECSNEVEREDSRRIRNNEACRKFRKTKTEKLKHLFDSEAKLIDQNSKLKEQLESLESQLNFLKSKLGFEKVNPASKD